MGEGVYVNIDMTGTVPDDEWLEFHRQLREACFKVVRMEVEAPRASSSIITRYSEGIYPEHQSTAEEACEFKT